MGDYNLTKVLQQYLETALWASSDDTGNSLDREYGIQDIDEANVEEQDEVLSDFLSKARAMELTDGLDLTQVAHDFYLTRNGHGAGFDDGDYDGSVANALTELAKSYGETYLYAGDDGFLYFG